jgi:hypothetical protein
MDEKSLVCEGLLHLWPQHALPHTYCEMCQDEVPELVTWAEGASVLCAQAVG